MKMPKPRPIARSNLLLAQWSRSVGELVAACTGPGFEAALCRALRRMVEFDFVMGFAYRGGERPVGLGDTLDPELRRILIDDYLNGPYVLDPFFQAILDGVHEGCHRLLDLAPDRFRQSEYFRAHYARTRIGEEVGFFFALPEQAVGVLSFARWNVHPALTRQEIELLRVIEPAVAGLCARHWAAAGRFPGAGTNGSDRSVGKAEPLALALERFGASRLSNREREIVTYVLQGHSTESIARNLDISPGTVKIHRKNIYRKLGISTQAQLFASFLSSMPG
jgi:DNA-binding CsgD family transcriptional regulator